MLKAKQEIKLRSALAGCDALVIAMYSGERYESYERA